MDRSNGPLFVIILLHFRWTLEGMCTKKIMKNFPFERCFTTRWRYISPNEEEKSQSALKRHQVWSSGNGKSKFSQYH